MAMRTRRSLFTMLRFRKGRPLPKNSSIRVPPQWRSRSWMTSASFGARASAWSIATRARCQPKLVGQPRPASATATKEQRLAKGRNHPVALEYVFAHGYAFHFDTSDGLSMPSSRPKDSTSTSFPAEETKLRSKFLSWQISISVSGAFVRPAYNVPASFDNRLVSAALILRSVAIV